MKNNKQLSHSCCDEGFSCTYWFHLQFSLFRLLVQQLVPWSLSYWCYRSSKTIKKLMNKSLLNMQWNEKKYLRFRKSWVTKSIEDRIIFENLSQFKSNLRIYNKEKLATSLYQLSWKAVTWKIFKHYLDSIHCGLNTCVHRVNVQCSLLQPLSPLEKLPKIVESYIYSNTIFKCYNLESLLYLLQAFLSITFPERLNFSLKWNSYLVIARN